MTLQACRDALLQVSRENGSHAGQLLSRFLRIPVGDTTAHPPERAALFAAIQAAQRNKELEAIYGLAFQRRQHSLQEAVQTYLTVQGRLIIGLGNESALETGITLHHTYGVPIIPGSALKGLAAHYCDQVWGAKQEEFKQTTSFQEDGQEKKRPGRYYKILFGTSEDSGDSGHIIFHDAWITPESLLQPHQGLVLDVMTPHHGDYYMAKDDTAPTDCDSPIPLIFLSVAGTFHIAASCDVTDGNGKAWELHAFHLLTQALATWGVGGKTNAGYGRMLDPSQVPTSSGKEQHTPQTAGPRYNVGDSVTVKRVEDPKGRGRPWFQADDGVGGVVTRGQAPQIEIGASTSLWIAAVTKDTYNFGADPPPSPRKPARKERRRR